LDASEPEDEFALRPNVASLVALPEVCEELRAAGVVDWLIDIAPGPGASGGL
jgi:hypothetical protein